MDWNNEADQLGTSNFFKPGIGQYKIKFLDNGQPDSYTDPQGKVTEQVRFKVLVNGEELDWSVSKGKTPASLYGQLALIGKKMGTLKDQEITLLVKTDGNKNEYTVPEAMELIEKWQAGRKSSTPTQSEESSGSSPFSHHHAQV